MSSCLLHGRSYAEYAGGFLHVALLVGHPSELQTGGLGLVVGAVLLRGSSVNSRHNGFDADDQCYTWRRTIS